MPRTRHGDQPKKSTNAALLEKVQIGCNLSDLIMPYYYDLAFSKANGHCVLLDAGIVDETAKKDEQMEWADYPAASRPDDDDVRVE
jgi:hypothetical protein